MPETKSMTCVVCPRGCRLLLELEKAEGEASPILRAVDGAGCRRGEEYARREIIDPRRVLTSTVRTNSHESPRLPVRSSGPLPLGRLREAVRALDEVVAAPPLRCGEALKKDWLGLGVDLIASDDLLEKP